MKLRRSCRKGHRLTKLNTYIRPGGTFRECRECRCVRRHAHYLKTGR